MKKNILILLIGGVVIFILFMFIGIYAYSRLLVPAKPVVTSSKSLSPKASAMPGASQNLAVIRFNVFPASTVVSKGKKYDFIVSLASQEQVLATDLDIAYDPQALKYVSIAPATFFKSPMQFSKSINEPLGTIFYSLGSLTPATGSGQLATVSFTAIKDASNIRLTLGPKTLASVKGDKKVQIVLPAY